MLTKFRPAFRPTITRPSLSLVTVHFRFIFTGFPLQIITYVNVTYQHTFWTTIYRTAQKQTSTDNEFLIFIEIISKNENQS